MQDIIGNDAILALQRNDPQPLTILLLAQSNPPPSRLGPNQLMPQLMPQVPQENVFIDAKAILSGLLSGAFISRR